ncbi:MAG: efflux transporter outer membrane subunit [Desulfamplus sp.]|nr:efflux transporter outer membrane subunit [Desulfamplus sp.]
MKQYMGVHAVELLNTLNLVTLYNLPLSKRSLQKKVSIKLSYLFFIPIFIATALIFSGCQSLTPKPDDLNNRVIIPDSYHNFKDRAISQNSPNTKWWEDFGSRELNSLIENALGNNFTLKESLARLKQAKALQDSQNTALLPSLNFNASVGRRASDTSGAAGASSYGNFSAGPVASYEVDLWGKIDAKTLEYQHRTSAAQFDLESVAISVAAEISNSWVELITVREVMALVKEQIKTNSMLLELLELRFKNSMSTALDVLQQQEVVAKIRSRIPALEIRQATLLNSIALLSGRASLSQIDIKTPNLGEIPAMPQAGIPSDLISNRPDIKGAGARLTASKWAIFQARADRLPSLNLNGSFLFQHATLESLLRNWILSLASNLNATLFDGGRNRAAVDLAIGVMDERLAGYQKAIFTAIMEVENSITSEKQRIKLIELLNAELSIAKIALEEAHNRYIKGGDSFIQVVTEELNVQNLEINLLEQKALLFKDRIALYRALGGRWTKGFVEQQFKKRTLKF